MSDSHVGLGDACPSIDEPDQGESSGTALPANTAASLEDDDFAIANDESLRLFSRENAGVESGPESIIDEEPFDNAQQSSEFDELRQSIHETQTTIRQELADVARSLGERLSSAARREEIISNQHAELQEYKRGSHFLMFKPFFNDLVRFYDHLQGVAADHVDDSVGDEFASLTEDLVELLERNDLEMFDSGTDNQLDRKTQHVVKVEATHDPDLDGTIARRLRNGFRYRDEYVVRPEQVVTWKYAPAPED